MNRQGLWGSAGDNQADEKAGCDQLMNSLRTFTVFSPLGAYCRGEPDWSLCLPYL